MCDKNPKRKILFMTYCEYEKLMVTQFPILFQDITCDSFSGIDIAYCWRVKFYNLCEKLQQIHKVTGIEIIFKKTIKEDDSTDEISYILNADKIKDDLDLDLWKSIISSIVSEINTVS